MSKYGVTFTKYEYYEVEANNADETEEKAFNLLDADDAIAFLFDPVDGIEVKEIERKN